MDCHPGNLTAAAAARRRRRPAPWQHETRRPTNTRRTPPARLSPLHQARNAECGNSGGFRHIACQLSSTFLQCTADTPQGWLQVSRQARRVEQDTYRSVHTARMIQGRWRGCTRFPAGRRTRPQGVLPLASQGVVAVHGAAWYDSSYAERCASSKRIAAAAGIRRWYQTGPRGYRGNKPPAMQYACQKPRRGSHIHIPTKTRVPAGSSPPRSTT